MINTTNKQILTVEAKRFSDETVLNKAMMRIGTPMQKSGKVIAKSQDYALYSADHMGVYLMTSDELNHVIHDPIGSDEYKSIMRMKSTSEFYRELKRLGSLPIEYADITADTVLGQDEFERVLLKECVSIERLQTRESRTHNSFDYRIAFNEGIGRVMEYIEPFTLHARILHKEEE